MKTINETNKNADILLKDLKERQKELNCLYKLEELLSDNEKSHSTIFSESLNIIRDGWQFPNITQVKIICKNEVFSTEDYIDSEYKLQAEIKVHGIKEGEIIVSYSEEVPKCENGFFLKEEEQLLDSIAIRIGQTILHTKLKTIYQEMSEGEKKLSKKDDSEWKIIVHLLQSSNPKLFGYLAQKMLYYLCWNGVSEANALLEKISQSEKNQNLLNLEDINQPRRKESPAILDSINNKIFQIASENLNEDLLLSNIRGWIEEDKSRFLIKALETPNSSISELINAVTRFRYLRDEGIKLSLSTDKSLRVSLIRHFFSDQLEYINIAKNHITITDYYQLVNKIIFPSKSHGKLGGKSAGLFLASRIIEKNQKELKSSDPIKTPNTWYITSDGLRDFLHYNNLENVMEQKYKEIDEIHVEYKNIIQIFKNSYFSPDIARGLSLAIDDLGEKPIIVRSSSLLEDRIGASFSGKYKSLFLANQGSREERLEALKDAIAEVYASTFGPDPIVYRKERGLLDFYEEMGIMIQEVIGHKVDHYFFPLFAGVAFSKNEFRWSKRIKREDGLIRMVPGLGTRAVDRLSEDYPILIAPGNPDLRVNVTPEEIIRYSPKYIDLIDLKTNDFKTVQIDSLLQELGSEIPAVHQILSVVKDRMIYKPNSLFNIDFKQDNLMVTFDGLLKNTDFIKQVKQILSILEEKMETPVDIEFAHDGENFYLLQCRAQSYSSDSHPTPIPKDLSQDMIAFSANQYISNGSIPDITHIVYVNPESYNNLSKKSDMQTVGQIVGKLNQILPKHQFILMGPGRWGSRGDIKLGVNITYSDINNTAVLIEIAKQKGNYVPELSFGTHFFQDLVEASIRYLPLYPDNKDVIFNQKFFESSKNILGDLLPEFASYEDTIKVIDVPDNMDDAILKISLNADLDEALAFFTNPNQRESLPIKKTSYLTTKTEKFWRWRYYMVEGIASNMDMLKFDVKNLYLFGSTKNASCGPCSDIDLLIHVGEDKEKQKELQLWLEGWSLSLAEMNYKKTGHKTKGLLDVHFVTDQDILNKTSYAVKIGAVTDAAKLIKARKE